MFILRNLPSSRKKVMKLLDLSTVIVAAVVRTHPQAIPLAMITTNKSIHGLPLVSYKIMGMGFRLAALRTTGALL